MEYYTFLLENLAFYSVDLGIRHFACALVGFGVIWMSRRWLAGKRPIPKLPRSRQIRREIFYSVLTIVICGCIAPAVIVLGLGAKLNFYGEVSDYGWVYFVFIICPSKCHRSAGCPFTPSRRSWLRLSLTR